MRLYQFYATATANASIQMLTRGHIVAVAWSAYITSGGGGDGVVAELSMQGTTQVAVNNPSGIISPFALKVATSTAVGFNLTTQHFMHNGLYCPVNVGDLVYLNTVVTTAVVLRALVHVQEGGR